MKREQASRTCHAPIIVRIQVWQVFKCLQFHKATSDAVAHYRCLDRYSTRTLFLAKPSEATAEVSDVLR